MEDIVPEVPSDDWNLNAEQVTKIIKRKKTEAHLAPTVLLISGGKRLLSYMKK